VIALPWLRSKLWVLVGAILCSSCTSHAHTASDRSGTAVIASAPTARTAQNAGPPLPHAIFTSKETGSIELSTLLGDTPDPCLVHKLHIGLTNASDLGRFVKMITSHHTIAEAKIDDPTGGHQVYELYGVTVTGKTLSEFDFPLVALNVAKLTRTNCGPWHP
jgi:hypothetical protein